MSYTATQICSILKTDPQTLSDLASDIEYITTDTRKIEYPSKSIFFALQGSMHDGHTFVHEAIQKGVKNIVTQDFNYSIPSGVNVYIVENCLLSLQKLATYHRSTFRDLEVLAITGSNGKTTIKEWLYQIIQDRHIVKSPKSYNSQTGVPLSVWQIKSEHQLAIFEAGISQIGEMEWLEPIIQPTIGAFTMVGSAHAEGFSSIYEKLEEKLILFKGTNIIIFEEDNEVVSKAIRNRYADKLLCSWGWNQDATLFRIIHVDYLESKTLVTISHFGDEVTIDIPFTDAASIQNVLHCWAIGLVLKVPKEILEAGVQKLHNLPMRMEMKIGIFDSILINDTYNADLQSFKIALEFLTQQTGNRNKMLIISDFMQTGLNPDELNRQIAAMISNHQIMDIVGIGKDIFGLAKHLDSKVSFHYFEHTDSFFQTLHTFNFDKKVILVKGARVFGLEVIIEALSEKIHSATLETDLQAIEYNVRMISQHLKGDTKIIAVIKASAYGSGSEELAKFLEYRKVAYLAVAYIDEGIQLRKAGVKLPIMILNPDANGIVDMIKYQLEPEIYSLAQLRDIIPFLGKEEHEPFSIHIKIDTGMHRLGFMDADIEDLCHLLHSHTYLHVRSIFSHLSSSEDPGDDQFTRYQVEKLNAQYNRIVAVLGYTPAKHILNSAGILRFPEYHFDMVRLGLGLYGIDSTATLTSALEKAHTLKASVIQIKNIKTTDYVGYNRKGKVSKDGKIAIINIGYADGLLRKAGNGNYSVCIQGKNYAILGNVCMDLTIIDIGTDATIQVGDEVIIFGKEKPIEELASCCETIPYEILSRISSRVKRVYVQA